MSEKPVMNGKPIIGLAPMAGITDYPMRLLSVRQGANYTCTEMVSVIGYMCAKPKNPTYQQLLYVHPEETNAACQLFGRDPVAMGEAAARVTELLRFTSIDINMGCPARKIVSSGEGSALLNTPDLAFRLMEAVRKNTYLPVTIKTRLGYDADTCTAPALVQAAESLGLQWVCVHGRTRAQQYAGQANYAAIAAIKAQARIPIIANGDVFTAGDAVRILRETGADGLMIGRGAMGNPWLFSESAHLLQSPGAAPLSPPTLTQRLDTALYHAQLMAEFKGEARGIVEMRKHVGHYISGLRGATAMRRAINQAKTLSELTALLTDLREAAAKEDIPS